MSTSNRLDLDQIASAAHVSKLAVWQMIFGDKKHLHASEIACIQDVPEKLHDVTVLPQRQEDHPGADLPVVEFDDIVIASKIAPPLTTLRQRMAEMGRLAFSQAQAFAQGQRPEAHAILLPADPIVRGSTGPPPGRLSTVSPPCPFAASQKEGRKTDDHAR